MRIQTINSIEISSLCDNQCEYCPAKDQHAHRPVGLMDRVTFEDAIKWALYFARRGTQREINLFGVGEPTLHPEIVSYVEYARRMLPFKQLLHLNTNANTMSEKLARELKSAGIDHIDITGHNARATARCIRIFQGVGIDGALSVDYMVRPNNWAGQVDWFEPTYDAGPCPWINNGQVMVMSNGWVTRCCIDAFALGVLGKISDDITKFDLTPFELCGRCHHRT